MADVPATPIEAAAGEAGRPRAATCWAACAYLAVGAVVVVGYFLLPGVGPLATRAVKVAAYCAVSLSSALALIVGIAWHRPRHPAPWWLLAASQVIYASADVTFFVRQDLLGLTAFPSISEVLYLAHYPPLLLGLALFIRRRTPGRDTAALLDGAILAVGAAILAWIYLLGPLVHAADTPAIVRMASLSFPVMDLAVLTVALRLIIGAGARTRAFWICVAALMSVLSADALYGLLQLAGIYSTGNLVEGLWLCYYLLLGATALHPSMRRLADPSPIAEQTLSGPRMALLGLASLSAPAALIIQQVRGAPLDIPVLAGGAAVLFALVLGRMASLVAVQRYAAVTDGLTKLHNRRFLEEQLRLDADRARRGHQQLSLVLLDIDHFKAINDTYGHPGGDRILCQVAERLQQVVRSGDVVARYGGEEFAILVPGLGGAQLTELAERLRQSIAGLPMRPNESAWVGITVSVGAASLPEHADSVAELVTFADNALYAAKHAGRNCSVIGRLGADVTAEARAIQATSAVSFLEELADHLDQVQSPSEHSTAIAAWAGAVAAHLGLDPATRQRCELAGRLHDVGKIVVPEAILTKPGPLTADELQIMRQHPARGGQLVTLAPELTEIAEIVRQHHERVDGTGYPDRLAGTEIRLEARIVALCDAYAAMRVDRSYRAALSVEQALDQIRDGRGTQFDPELADIFLGLLATGVIGELPLRTRA
jgi:two-component system, cell cycle response regulator